MTHTHHFATAADAKSYALASDGRHGAKLTLTSKVTGAWYTYKISRAMDRATEELQNRWFVSLLAGPDNTADYVYIGMIEGTGEFHTTKGTKLPHDSKPIRGFNYFWRHVLMGELPTDMTARHESTCGRCGRPLTTPASVDTGLGPICAAELGVPHEARTPLKAEAVEPSGYAETSWGEPI